MNEGFYKNDGLTLLYAPNFVFNSEYTLLKEDKDELLWMDVFPIDGWYWFDSKEEAVAQLGIDVYDPPKENVVPEKKPKPDPRNDII